MVSQQKSKTGRAVATPPGDTQTGCLQREGVGYRPPPRRVSGGSPGREAGKDRAGDGATVTHLWGLGPKHSQSLAEWPHGKRVASMRESERENVYTF